ncbi:MAG TPA: PDZ domain-containing protein [Firmicutes bacterium]|nr:PDZ domain-containing protein [Bacillota bacterium]
MRKLLKAIAVVALGAALLFLRTGYLIVRPGSAEDLSRIVKAEQKAGTDAGSFYLVTVTQQYASPMLLLYGLVDPIVDVRPKSSVIPPGIDPKDYRKLMVRWMEESQNLAKVIALRKLGYEVPLTSDGVEVVQVEQNSPAKGLLFPGDIITAVDGRTVYLTDELMDIVQSRPVGDTVRLEVKRNGESREVTVATTTHTELPEKAAIRVLIRTLNWQPVLPLKIDIEVGKISGPSAGLMFVLEILNQLDPRDLTGGQKIAGTGTINLEEKIGPIGGVRQKVRAAEEQGAEYFLVPLENYEEAQTAVRSITLVPVGTLDDALHFLYSLEKR